MKKVLIMLVCLLQISMLPLNVFANGVELESKSAIVVNRLNDNILFEKYKDLQLPIASLTKIMTVMVTLENISNLDEVVMVDSDDIGGLSGYQVIGLTDGMSVSFRDLVYSTLLYSAADSAKVLANNVFGNFDEFVVEMNNLASSVGMENTHFSNSIGIDANNYSTSYDLYKLLDYALDNKTFYEIFTAKSYKMKCFDKLISSDLNEVIRNADLDVDGINFEGFKGGYTSNSGLSLGAFVTFDDNEFIIITIGAMDDMNSKKNIIDALNILNGIKNEFSNRVILKKDVLVDNIIYKDKNSEKSYEVRSQNELKYYMDNRIDLNYLKSFYEGMTIIDSEVKQGDKIGKISVYYNDELLDSVDVVFSKKYIVKSDKDYKNILIFVGICFLGLVVFRKRK